MISILLAPIPHGQLMLSRDNIEHAFGKRHDASPAKFSWRTWNVRYGINLALFDIKGTLLRRTARSVTSVYAIEQFSARRSNHNAPSLVRPSAARPVVVSI
jgi:hypothetical protein